MANRYTFVVLVCCILFPGQVSANSPSLGSLDVTYARLAESRSRQIARLHEYAAASNFPLNKDYPGQLVPYFVDASGTACAVGHLMRLDARRDLVASIASRTNHVRIEHVHCGPLFEWIRDSGLTQDECALIQPSYACIEDYRRGREWQDEVTRLQKHFSEVEQTLISDSQRSLCNTLIAKVDQQLERFPDDPALSLEALSESLRSDVRNVRIAATYAIAALSQPSKQARLEALEASLNDADPSARFWAAVAIEKIGAASPRGKLELHHQTLPVFLETYRNGPDDLRLAALLQLAYVAPESMGTNRQFRIIPKIRQAMVSSGLRDNGDASALARRTLGTFRWQRLVYESDRIPRHYLAGSAELEAAATEALALSREFVQPPLSIDFLNDAMEYRDRSQSISYLLPVGTDEKLPIADTADHAKKIVDEYYRKTYKKHLAEAESPIPFWEIVSAEADAGGLCYVVVVRRTDIDRDSPKLIHVVPSPAMVAAVSSLPYYWFDRVNAARPDALVGGRQFIYQPSDKVRIVFGTFARKDAEAFATTCDLFAYFFAHHSLLIVDREIQSAPEAFTWSGRFASLRNYVPRFFEQGGGGSSVYGGGGWEFHRLEIGCDRQTGAVSLKVEPIDYPLVQLSDDVLSPEWTIDEKKLMGWKPLKSLDFFGDRLFPPEYQQGIDAFNSKNVNEARRILYRRHHFEKSLPPMEFMFGLLYDSAGEHDQAKKFMSAAASRAEHDPNTIANVARWELQTGLLDDARLHAQSALQLSPGHSEAKLVLAQINQSDERSD